MILAFLLSWMAPLWWLGLVACKTICPVCYKASLNRGRTRFCSGEPHRDQNTPIFGMGQCLLS